MTNKDLKLNEYISREYFKIDLPSKGSWPEGWNAGLFDYEIKLRDINDEEIDILAEWLVENCSSNFIVHKTTKQIIAGGNSNNLKNWQTRKIHGINSNYESIEVSIRLYEKDISAFRLTWVL